MPPPVLETPYDAALWLLSNLEGIRESALDSEVLEGWLPQDVDFEQVVASLQQWQGGLFQGATHQLRVIRFSPERGAVYQSLASMLNQQRANKTGIPARFYLRDIQYTYDGNREGAPSPVRGYLDAVVLCNTLVCLSDYTSTSGRVLHFVVRPDAKFVIPLEYLADDLRPIEDLHAFFRDFIDSDLHQQEKRDIARDGLAELAKTRGTITISELIKSFDAFFRNVKASYALLLSKFSIASVQREIDKQNLEDALRLNKTFSEVQNQLLALPAALLVAGATIESEASFKNVSVMVGISIFVVLMWLLIRNQKNSVRAIDSELQVRRDNLNNQPEAIAIRYKGAFNVLTKRIKTQLVVLNVVLGLVLLVFALVLYAVIDSALAGGLLSQLHVLIRAWHQS
jgi:hypothetical protein